MWLTEIGILAVNTWQSKMKRLECTVLRRDCFFHKLFYCIIFPLDSTVVGGYLMKRQADVGWRKWTLFFFVLLKKLHALIINVNLMRCSPETFVLKWLISKIVFIIEFKSWNSSFTSLKVNLLEWVVYVNSVKKILSFFYQELHSSHKPGALMASTGHTVTTYQ